MTPNEIEVLIHYHTSRTAHPRLNAPAVQAAVRMFEQTGIFEQDNGIYHTTDRGKALVQVLCNTPFPREAWVDENGIVIDFDI